MPNMTYKDREQLRRWIASGASLGEVESVPQTGLVGNERFTEQARRAYKLLWTWSAPRFSGSAGFKQDKYFNRRGYAALEQRFARCRAHIARLSGVHS